MAVSGRARPLMAGAMVALGLFSVLLLETYAEGPAIKGFEAIADDLSAASPLLADRAAQEAGAGEVDSNTPARPAASKDISPRFPTAALLESSVKIPRIFTGSAPSSAEDLLSMEQHWQTLIDSLRKATVSVQVGNSHGSGVIISPDGYILSVAHVTQQPNTRVRILLDTGEEAFAKSLNLNRRRDLAVLKMEKPGPWPYAKVRSENPVATGEWILSLGHPGGYRPGRQPVARIGRTVHSGQRQIQTDCPIEPGDSGGPLFDMSGRVVGIHARIGTAMDMNIHVPIRYYLNEWDELSTISGPASSGSSAGYIGVTIADEASDCRVSEVRSGFPAQKVGLQAGDVIIRLGTDDIDSFDSLLDALAKFKPGDKTEIRFLRDGQEIARQIDFVAKP